MPKIRVTLSIGISNASQEDFIDIDDAEWSGCKNDEERESLMEAYWQEWMRGYIDGCYEVVE